MRFVDLVPQLLIEERTDIDFAMTPASFVPQQMIDAGGVLPLFVNKFVAVVAKDHALAVPGASLTDLLAGTPSIVFGNDDPLVPKELKGTSQVRVEGSPTLAVVQQFLSQPLLALLSGSIAVVPLRLVELILPVVPLHVLDVPVPKIQVEVVLAWPKRRNGDADHRWFRELIAAQLCDNRFR